MSWVRFFTCLIHLYSCDYFDLLISFRTLGKGVKVSMWHGYTYLHFGTLMQLMPWKSIQGIPSLVVKVK
jgi:hypothetical protein